MTVPADRQSVTACVLFLRWREAAAVAGPGAPREQRLLAMARAAIQGWAPASRVVLEAPDGLAIVATVAPAQAARAARRAALADADQSVTVAVHHGMVEAQADPQGQARLRGEGVDGAASLAAGARGQHVLTSQAFRQALAAAPAASGRRAVLRNVLGLGGLAALIGAGVWIRSAREAAEAARRPAVLDLDIRPWGDISVDGESKGRSPPVVKLSIPPGAHTLEIRNGNAKPLHLELELQPGEVLEVKHVFAGPPPTRPGRRRQQRGLLDRFKFW